MGFEIRKFDYIDCVRGLAVLAVLVDHTGLLGLTPASRLIGFLVAQGARGVQLFYVASALTLFLSLSQRAGREASPKLDFFVRRFFRIAPLYWLAVLYYLWQNGLGPNYWTGGDRPVALSAVAANLAFVHGAAPRWIDSVVPGGWSIAVEMPFYLAVPILFDAYSRSRDRRRALHALFLGSLAASYLLRLALHRHPLIDDARLWTEYLFLFPPAHFPVFVLGFLVFDEISSPRPAGAARLLAAVGTAVVLGALTFRLGGARLVQPHVAVSVLLGLLVVVLQRTQPALLVNRPLVLVGRLSYSIYLTHFAAIHALQKSGAIAAIAATAAPAAVRFAAAFAAMLAASLALSSLTNRLIEEPGRELGKRLVERLERGRVRRAEAAA